MKLSTLFKPGKYASDQTAASGNDCSYLEEFFQSNADACVIYERESGIISNCNRRVNQMFELPENTCFKGLYMSQVMLRHLNDGSVNTELLMNNIPDGWFGEASFVTHTKYPFCAHIKCLPFKKGDLHYQIVSIRDITEIKQAEMRLRTSKTAVEEASLAKARFLSSISHELRTPLNGIIGTANLILSDKTLQEGIKKHINVLRYSSEHMLGIINDILDFSKIDAGKLELNSYEFNLKDAVDNIAGSFLSQYNAKKIELITKYHPLLQRANIKSDKIKLSQVITNLLSNALKFTHTGSVTLKVNIEKFSTEEIVVQFEVEDTGIGIPEDKVKDIFRAFTQVHNAADLKRTYGGTGLGLTISDMLVQIFGGKMQVESNPGKGTRFYFSITFPLAATYNEVPGEFLPAEQPKDIKGVRILVVEDNEINASILSGFLNKWKVRMMEASHGIQALELLKYHKFDLILLDLEMPEMDGYTTIKKIKEQGIETPVMAFTATLLDNMEESLKEAGFTDYILKPFRPAELKKKIETHAPHRVFDYA
jgi:signal transduction histidine kinase/CheY-like chemotaxis protein